MSRYAIRTSFFLLGLAVLVSGAIQPAWAYMPVHQNDLYEIKLPEFDQFGHDSYVKDVGMLSASNAVSERYGGSWAAFSWNSQTNTPVFVYGTGAELGVSVASNDALEQMARQVIADNPEVFRAELENLSLESTREGLGKRVAHFQQTYQGLPVWGTKVLVAFNEAGRLLLMSSEYYNDITVSETPAIPAADAVRIAQSALPFNPATDRIEGQTELLVLPVPQAVNEVEHHLVWRVTVRTEEPLGKWVTHVDAHDGEIIWRYNDIHFAYYGDTEMPVHHYVYCDGAPEQQTIPYLDINVSGVGTTTSDENGNWNIAGSGGFRTVTAELVGDYCDVYNNAAGDEALFTGSAQENVPFTVEFDNTNSQQDERDVFQGVTEVHDFFQLFAPEFPYANAQIGAEVSINSSCNAYWDGNIHFYREAGGCANTGEMHQVVHHEFGHGVQNAIIGGQGGQGLGEGNSDILGNLITQDNIIGRGFYLNNCVSGIRNSDNNLVYPDDVIGQQIHYAGQVIAGFNWDSMVLLQDLYGTAQGTVESATRWHYGRVLLDPETQPAQVFATFFADDDDDNMDNGTPHHAIFCEAALNHGFDCPAILDGVYITHTAHPYTGDTSFDYEIEAVIVSLSGGEPGGVINDGTVRIDYRINGGPFMTTSMSPGGNPDTYVGYIPAQGWNTVVEYFLYAENMDGQFAYSPNNAPTALHYFQVGEDITDEFEFDTAWTVGDEGDGASTGVWERVDPVGTAAQPEDDHTADPGTDCFVTGNGSVGGGVGENDVDGGKTTLMSPIFDLSIAQEASISYYRWYSNNQGNAPDSDTWYVDISNDGGVTWTSVENTMVTNQSWLLVSFNVFDYFASPDLVRMRFVAEDAGDGSIVEAGVDDFMLMALMDATDADDGMTVNFVTDLGQNVPNPFNPKTEIRFSLQAAGPASLKVYDAQGRVVSTLVDGPLAEGSHQVTWNGTDSNGNTVASGIYFYRLMAEGQTYNKRMVLLK